MEYNISKYIVSQPLNENEMLLYSTLSTSIVTLENDIYSDIFQKKAFDLYVDECVELENMGFLFVGNADEQLYKLKEIRKTIVEVDHGITAITIAPTMECNARCYYCFEKGAAQGAMSMETAESVAKFLIDKCTSKELYISWFGGEPLMAKEIISFITSKILDAGIKLESTLTTNGILIDDEVISVLSYWNTKRVQITLDGIGEEYNKIKNYTIAVENPFERIVENIRKLIDKDVCVHLRVNYLSTEYEKVKECMDYLHDEFGSYKKLYLYGVPLDLPKVKGYSEFSDIEGDIFLKVLDDSLKRGYENEELNFSALRVSKQYNKALGELMLAPFPASCYMVNKDRFVIDDKGLLYKCQKHLGQKKYSCGNIFDGVDENEIYDFYVTDQLHDEVCMECNILPICQGGCKANRLLYGSKYACPPSKSIVDKLVKKYYEYLTNGNEY